MKKLNLMTVVLAVLSLSVIGWGNCQSSSYSEAVEIALKTYANECSASGAEITCSNITYYSSCAERLPNTSDIPANKYYAYTFEAYNTRTALCRDNGIKAGCGQKNYTYSMTRCQFYYCDTQRQADSASCIHSHNTWQDGTCKVNHCKAADSTWLSTSIAACTGSNNYAIVNTDSTCEHVGTCCPNDSIPSGNVCKWRCDSVLTQCNGRAGALFGAVLPDTSVSGQDTTFSYQCFYNCAYSPNPDSTVYLVEGNTVLAGPSDSIADGIKSEWFSSVRSTTGGIYVYDYLSPTASEYVDSIAAMKCVEHLWRCVINNKYVYWYDNQEVPAGCTNIVRVK